MFFFTALKEILGSKNFLSSISEETTNGNDQDFNTCRVKRIWGSKTIVIKWVLRPNFVKCKQCQLVYKFKKKILSIGNQVSYFSFTVLFWNYWRTVIGKCNPTIWIRSKRKIFANLMKTTAIKRVKSRTGHLFFIRSSRPAPFFSSSFRPSSSWSPPWPTRDTASHAHRQLRQ